MKITRKSSDSNSGLHGAFVFEQHQMDQLVGELLTIIEALGLKESQEKSLKDIIRQKVWSTADSAFYISGKILVLAQDMIWEITDENNQLSAGSSKDDRRKGLHPKWLDGEFELTFISKD